MNQTLRAMIVGTALGLFVTLVPSCGKKPVLGCNASNCAGCCDDTGTCFKGISGEACGASGASCEVCTSAQSCVRADAASPDFGGKCVSGSTGDGGMAGGSAGGTAGGNNGGGRNGGGTAGGGSAGGASAGGGAASCSPANCNTCCLPTGVCAPAINNGRCASPGMACVACMNGNTCVAGACTPCTGCIDIGDGMCKPGTAATSCGKAGAFCQGCDTTGGFACNNQACVGTGTCSAASCSDGCCDGNNCVARNQFSTAQCGNGSPGGACTSCPGTQSCGLDAGMCEGGNTGAGGGGVFPGFDGGGFPGTCDATTPCSNGSCCAQGLCIPNGTNVLLGKTCGPNGGSCAICNFITGPCNVTTGVCG